VVHWIGVGRRSDRPAAGSNLCGDAAVLPALDITVIFTTPAATKAALEAAARFGQDLIMNLTLFVPHVVPRQLPLTRPAVALGHLRRVAVELLSHIGLNDRVNVQICLCRSLQECCRSVVPAGSLVVIGRRKSWWPGSEWGFARRMRSSGYDVVLVDPKGREDA
jgi:hypothetical protein